LRGVKCATKAVRLRRSIVMIRAHNAKHFRRQTDPQYWAELRNPSPAL